MPTSKHSNKNGVMLNAYPDSMGGRLDAAVRLLSSPAFEGAFQYFYILPTFFNSDLDRGFSVIDYHFNSDLVSEDDLDRLRDMGIKLKFDIVLNHLSVASPQFQDMLKNGDASEYKDFFINWNEFWNGHGTMNDEGIVIPHKHYLDKLFMRKSGLPILKVTFPDGSERPYWNTFYQEVNEVAGKKTYLGQMDVNAKSEKVWQYYEEVLDQLKAYGCSIVRLDAFAYLHKEVGETNFFNKPGTWYYLDRIKQMAVHKGLTLLPEIHAEYGLHLHDEVADKGYMIYDFFLPGLLIHTIEKKDTHALVNWLKVTISKGFDTVHMLGCHDGIPILDLKGKEVGGHLEPGLLTDGEIDEVMDVVMQRGGRVKNLYDADGKKLSYYQVNATYYSALGEDDAKMLVARAIQMFCPGIPQVWYLDLFGGKNDYDAADKAGAGGHKEINRTNLNMDDIQSSMQTHLFNEQIRLIQLRNTHPAFEGTLTIEDPSHPHLLHLKWQNGDNSVGLKIDLSTMNYSIEEG